MCGKGAKLISSKKKVERERKEEKRKIDRKMDRKKKNIQTYRRKICIKKYIQGRSS